MFTQGKMDVNESVPALGGATVVRLDYGAENK